VVVEVVEGNQDILPVEVVGRVEDTRKLLSLKQPPRWPSLLGLVELQEQVPEEMVEMELQQVSRRILRPFS
jgi:hypothetical protein